MPDTYDLSGRRIAFLVANEGVEQVELTTPWQAVIDEGGGSPDSSRRTAARCRR